MSWKIGWGDDIFHCPKSTDRGETRARYYCLPNSSGRAPAPHDPVAPHHHLSLFGFPLLPFSTMHPHCSAHLPVQPRPGHLSLIISAAWCTLSSWLKAPHSAAACRLGSKELCRLRSMLTVSAFQRRRKDFHLVGITCNSVPQGLERSTWFYPSQRLTRTPELFTGLNSAFSCTCAMPLEITLLNSMQQLLSGSRLWWSIEINRAMRIDTSWVSALRSSPRQWFIILIGCEAMLSLYYILTLALILQTPKLVCNFTHMSSSHNLLQHLLDKGFSNYT